jgi:hypothetical protein
MEVIFNFMLQQFYPRGNNPESPLKKYAGWAPDQVWKFCRRVKSLGPAVNQTPDLSAHSLIIILTTLTGPSH